jgi:hypothetical protein
MEEMKMKIENITLHRITDGVLNTHFTCDKYMPAEIVSI